MGSFEIVQWIIRGALAVVFIGMGVNHFVPRAARVMAQLIPPGLRFGRILSPINLVYFTGLCEIAGGIGLLVPVLRTPAAVALVVLLIAVFPANAYAALHPERFGRVAVPFWRRYFGQLALILLVVLAAV